MRRLWSKPCWRGHSWSWMNSRNLWVTMLVELTANKHSGVLEKLFMGVSLETVPYPGGVPMETDACWVPQEPRLNSWLQCRSWMQRSLPRGGVKTQGTLQDLPGIDIVWGGWHAKEISTGETAQEPAQQACQNEKGNTSLLLLLSSLLYWQGVNILPAGRWDI